mmetsp:Transcript_25998/g.45325  ORF Transcript_25998/g.45325 Transcript_25998/m.45325 type:complete len:87 (-) Transcript_25998:10-270(-)
MVASKNHVAIWSGSKGASKPFFLTVRDWFILNRFYFSTFFGDAIVRISECQNGALETTPGPKGGKQKNLAFCPHLCYDPMTMMKTP